MRVLGNVATALALIYGWCRHGEPPDHRVHVSTELLPPASHAAPGEHQPPPRAPAPQAGALQESAEGEVFPVQVKVVGAPESSRMTDVVTPGGCG